MSELLAILADGRTESEARMTETLRAGLWVETVNPDTLETTPVFDLLLTSPGLIKYPTLTVSDQDAGGQQFGEQDITAKLPIAAPLIPEGYTIIVDASTSDPSLAGRQFRVKGSPQSGQVTSHRYPVEES